MAFGKQHKHVLRTIRGMLESKRPRIAHHARSNLGPGSYLDANGQERTTYQMTARDSSDSEMRLTGFQARVTRI